MVGDNTTNFTQFQSSLYDPPPPRLPLWCYQNIWFRCTAFTQWMVIRYGADSGTGPASRPRSPFCVCDHVHIAKKPSEVHSIHEWVRVYASPKRPSLSEVTTTAIHCVRFQISWQLTGKGDHWQDRQHTDRWWHMLSLTLLRSDTHYCVILWVTIQIAQP